MKVGAAIGEKPTPLLPRRARTNSFAGLVGGQGAVPDMDEPPPPRVGALPPDTNPPFVRLPGIPY